MTVDDNAGAGALDGFVNSEQDEPHLEHQTGDPDREEVARRDTIASCQPFGCRKCYTAMLVID